MIPLEKIVAIAAGLIYNDYMNRFVIGCKCNMRNKTINYLIKTLNETQIYYYYFII